MMTENQRKAIRVDLQLIADMIEPNSRVLDIGCEDGTLLDYLVNFKQVDGRGIELSTEGVNACVSAGLPVIQGDADTDLATYPDNAFDYVVLSQTLQAMVAPRTVVKHLVRIGKRAIVSFPNFGHWRARSHLALTGRMPVSDALPYQWYDTPNIHLCTIKDFVEMCRETETIIERSISLNERGNARRINSGPLLANLFGVQAVFVLRR
ncbi:MAG: methionine biosynthesis protein MetW [Rhodospirillales bacterium]|jgi:methionine biosynthesis protein MetW|nr:methionine biosynthesis protein MetW [Rhodospirillales bacterium]